MDRATRIGVDARRDPDTARGAIARIAQQLGVHPEALRAALTLKQVMGYPAHPARGATQPHHRQSVATTARTCPAIVNPSLSWHPLVISSSAGRVVERVYGNRPNAVSRAFRTICWSIGSCTRLPPKQIDPAENTNPRLAVS
jgi:transposase